MIKLLLIVSFASLAWAIPIDNGVEGDPEIECGPTSITVQFNTQNAFEGHTYVKGLYSEEGCRVDASPGIELPFDTCNVVRTRSLNPKGVFVSVTVIISFHPLFMTKVDRAYKLQCFYMEADKTVSTDIEVSMITTAFQTEFVPMPICRYEILEDGPEGAPVQYALIGDQIYHKWTCDTETIDTFCMYVYSCFVDDGNGDVVDLINEDGCALDRYLLNNIEYPTDLIGGVEAHVFKYADRPQLFFQCQIQITVKEPNGECIRPDCPEPPLVSRRGRFRRSLDSANVLDVRAELNSLDVDDQVSLPSELRHRAPAPIFHYNALAHQGVCLTPVAFGAFVAFVILLTAAIAFTTVTYLRRK